MQWQVFISSIKSSHIASHIPFMTHTFIAFVGSIGDDYGPSVHWLPKALQKYGKAENPTTFLNKSSHKCYVTFEATFSRGDYGTIG